MAESALRVAVAGASGYTGGELTRLLLEHPNAEPVFLSAERHAGKRLGTVHPALRNHPAATGLRLAPLTEMPEVDVVFSCMPTGTAPELAPALAKNSDHLVNLAGDFRLDDTEEVRRRYPATADHPPPGRFVNFVPELADGAPDSAFVSVPGCMAVATVYALQPLFAAALVDARVVVDAKTGSTGGGRTGGEHPAERNGNFRVHKLHGHRHAPEVSQVLGETTGQRPDLQFSAHSLDTPRGIVVTAYTRLLPGRTALDVKRAFGRAYARTPFVRMRNSPRAPHEFPMLKAVVGSNVAEVALSVQEDRCVVVCALDNLLKGAAGQAVQIMNRTVGLDERAGLPSTAVLP
ncbi:N-acetyl-gamma-glutamyl-phosphate reductase 1 [Nocardiopsis kunsanensis]|uniref:N-acetyl-gamma-glutamyl-phosphate reductase n=1 Tax=Nocardiopsis kunsanensis TaxID=141693 RepID=A0A918XIU7_9ACTN|nr:N-acetyl-gamma-glutamyl-phosphate reductase [Nocardiopsis kunsanensis]GHD32591.1 N-acetyl-gamma-glutamyl-phosphate reductase 1 [Nocardiopsis kunsanensis]